jgi:hypothetical protein
MGIFSKLFSSKDEVPVEDKYFEKYKEILKEQDILQLIDEYADGIIVFEPIRSTLTIQDQENLFKQIDDSDLLTSKEKMETIIGFMMILDGSFPNDKIVINIGKVFGNELLETIEKKRNEFKSEIAVKRVIKYIKSKEFLTNRST